MSLPVRVAALLAALAAVIVVGVFITVHFLAGGLPVIDYTGMAHGGQVNVVLQEDPQTTVSSRPDWVTYFVQDPATRKWVHTTLFKVPAGTRVNLTILGYDGCTPLRNNYFSKVIGTIGGTASVQQFKDTTPVGPARTVSSINSWSNCSVGHTFAIPALNLFVPVPSPVTKLFDTVPCTTSPCVSGPYALEKFSFMTPRHGGSYRWQCFVPCGGGFVDGNGGPMQTLGYMGGFMEVA